MNWISHWKKIGIKVKQILKKQPVGQQETDWKNCPQCKKISYLPDLIANSYICECSFHFDLPPKLRLDSLFDSDYEIIEVPENINPDPLNFEVREGARQGYKYIDKVIVGVDNSKQFKELVVSAKTLKINVKSVDASKEIGLINPSKW